MEFYSEPFILLWPTQWRYYEVHATTHLIENTSVIGQSSQYCFFELNKFANHWPLIKTFIQFVNFKMTTHLHMSGMD